MPKLVIVKSEDSDIARVINNISRSQMLDCKEVGLLIKLIAQADKLEITIEKLAKRFNMGTTSVRKIIKSLIQKGFLSREAKYYTSDSSRPSREFIYYLYESPLMNKAINPEEGVDVQNEHVQNGYVQNEYVQNHNYVYIKDVYYNYLSLIINKKYKVVRSTTHNCCFEHVQNELLQATKPVTLFNGTVSLVIKKNSLCKKTSPLNSKRNSDPVNLNVWLDHDVNDFGNGVSIADDKLKLFERRIHPEGKSVANIMNHWNNVAKTIKISSGNGKNKRPVVHRITDSQVTHTCQVIITALIRLYNFSEGEIKIAIDNYKKILDNSPWYKQCYSFPQFYSNHRLFRDCIEGNVSKNCRYFNYDPEPKVIKDKATLLKMAYNQFSRETGREPSKAERIAIQCEIGLHSN